MDKIRNDKLFMIVIGWKTVIGKSLKNIIKLLPEQEKIAKEEVLKTSLSNLSQLHSNVIALVTQTAYLSGK